jgi:hypothetical protein
MILLTSAITIHILVFPWRLPTCITDCTFHATGHVSTQLSCLSYRFPPVPAKFLTETQSVLNIIRNVQVPNGGLRFLQAVKVNDNNTFYIRGSVHLNSKLIRSNKMQPDSGIYLLQNHSTCSGCPSHPSSGVNKTVIAASGTDHSILVKTFLQRGLIGPRWRRCVLKGFKRPIAKT